MFLPREGPDKDSQDGLVIRVGEAGFEPARLPLLRRCDLPLSTRPEDPASIAPQAQVPRQGLEP